MGMTVIEQDTMHAIQSACRKYTKEKKEIDWEQRRYEVAKDMFASPNFFTHNHSVCSWVEENGSVQKLMARRAVQFADALIEELKKKGE